MGLWGHVLLTESRSHPPLKIDLESQNLGNYQTNCAVRYVRIWEGTYVTDQGMTGPHIVQSNLKNQNNLTYIENDTQKFVKYYKEHLLKILV